MQLMLGEVVIIAFVLGGILGAAIALHLKATPNRRQLKPKGKKS